MQSKITGGSTTLIFEDIILGKHKVGFYRCNDTGFIQTDKVHWLEEAYTSAITNLDLGLVERNVQLSKTVYPILLKYFYEDQKFLDYGGGYGLFVRMMRDKGFNFFLYDTYCENIFVPHLDIKNLTDETEKFDAITAFEVFEHLDDPMAEIALLLQHSHTIIFSTEIIPNQEFKTAQDWWYFSPSTGQHIAFYSIAALEYIAKHFQLQLYTNRQNLHILTRRQWKQDPFQYLIGLERMESRLNSLRKRWYKFKGVKLQKGSLLGHDVEQTMKRNQ
jgi:2-polyprenyl-3-methyl-5-hydroxy-6-metoxy-1,4-benzoquinol methylase